MFATFVITIAIVTPMAAARLVEDRRHEWLFWTVVTVATVAHVAIDRRSADGVLFDIYGRDLACDL